MESDLASPLLRTRCTLTLRGHGHKVQCSVQTTLQLAEINIKCELIADQIEHLIIIRILHKIRA
jgi:hypothetical protein